jgi:hypothetical protein
MVGGLGNMTSLVDELWKRVEDREDKFHKICDKIVDEYLIKKEGYTREDMRHLLISIVDRVEAPRNDMIRASNIWSEFKRQEE